MKKLIPILLSAILLLSSAAVVSGAGGAAPTAYEYDVMRESAAFLGSYFFGQFAVASPVTLAVKAEELYPDAAAYKMTEFGETLDRVALTEEEFSDVFYALYPSAPGNFFYGQIKNDYQSSYDGASGKYVLVMPAGADASGVTDPVLAGYVADGGAYDFYLKKDGIFYQFRLEPSGASDNVTSVAWNVEPPTDFDDAPAPDGDVNGDGKINARDVIALMNAVLGKSAPGFSFYCADVYTDGRLNARDVQAVMKAMLS